MGLIVFAIAAAPTVFVYLVGLKGYSRGNLYAAAVVAGAVGVFTGNPVYAGLDLFFVLLGLYFGYQTQSSRIKLKQREDERLERVAAMKNATEGWEGRCAEMDVKLAEMKAKSEARRTELLRLRAEAEALSQKTLAKAKAQAFKNKKK